MSYKKIKFVLSGLFGLMIHFNAVSQNAQQLQNLNDLAVFFAERHNQRKAEALVKARSMRLITVEDLPGVGKRELMYFDGNQPVYYTTFNDDAAKTTSTNHIQVGGSTGYDLTGSTETLGIWDGGTTLTTHQEFGGRVTKSDGSSSINYHATHVGGTMIASGVAASAKGMSSEALLLSYDWDNDFSEMALAAAAGMLVSNHSYGYVRGWYGDVWYGDPSISTTEDYKFGFYDNYSRDLDFIANDAPYYNIVWAAGNDRNDTAPDGEVAEDDGGPDGFDCIDQLGVAKNILTIGAVGDLTNGYTTPGAVSMSSFSGWGPTDDGRVKPDLVGNGIGLTSTYNTSNTAYASLSGTSMASPNISGSIGLLLEHQRNLYGDVVMRSSTIKALLIHTADEAGNTGPDYSFGWGLANFKTAAELISTNYSTGINIKEYELTNGNTINFQVLKDASKDLNVTIVWNDPAGTPPSASLNPRDKMLVNDLDLRLDNGTTFMPWVLDVENPSNAATKGDNITDNVEQVIVENSSEELITVQISHKGTLSGGSQIVSVIVTGNKALMGDESVNNQTVNGESTYWVTGTIESNATIGSSANVNFIAGTSITLNPGFTVEAGATFSAQIYDPTNLWVNDARMIYPGFIYERNVQDQASIPTIPALHPSINEVEPFKKETTAFTLSPNPAVNILNINLGLPLNQSIPRYVQIIDGMGKVLQTIQKEHIKATVLTVPITNYPPGIYFVKGVFDNEIQTQKFVITQ